VDASFSSFPGRIVDPPDAPGAFAGLDGVLATHDHVDHLDAEAWPALAQASPRARFVVPRPAAGRAADVVGGAERVDAVAPDERLRVGAAGIQVAPAWHALDPREDAYGPGGDPPQFVGFLVELGGLRIYHAGDTVPFPGLEDRLAALSPDVCLLPINGRDAEREAQGLAGNLTAEEATDLAATSGARLLVPMHWDLVEGNLGDPARCVQRARDVAPHLGVLVAPRFRPVGLAP
jgi:L-ascorbate metabolism protein UlaG (beta-lactamase superfamily)